MAATPANAPQNRRLTDGNHEKGFLIDDNWMASVSRNAEGPGFSAFVVDHAWGETVAWKEFSALQDALDWVNAIPRTWVYESTSGCGDGGCSGEKCGPSKCRREACGIYVPTAP